MVKHTRDVAWIAGIVYFAQGAIGISGIALPLFMRGLNWSVSEITAVSSLAAFPWAFKILYGLLSDVFPLFGYRRKSYLILFSILSAFGWLFLVVLPSEKQWILASLMVANLGFAATDVITDGLIVEHSTEFTSHIYQSIAWGSRSFGAIFSGVIGGWLAANWPPEKVFLITMLLPLAVTFGALFIREKKRFCGPFHSVWAPIKRCFHLMMTQNLRLFAALLVVASVSSSFGLPFFFFMKETLGFRETFLGLLISIGWLGAMAGSVIYGQWLRNISPKIILRWAIWINSLNIVSTLFILDEKSAFILIFIGGIMSCITILPIMSAAAVLTHHSGVESSLFAILMSVYNFGQILFGYTGGKLFNVVGLYPLIVLTGAISLFGLIFVELLEFEKK